jgi:hypothetical protein
VQILAPAYLNRTPPSSLGGEWLWSVIGSIAPRTLGLIWVRGPGRHGVGFSTRDGPSGVRSFYGARAVGRTDGLGFPA